MLTSLPGYADNSETCGTQVSTLLIVSEGVTVSQFFHFDVDFSVTRCFFDIFNLSGVLVRHGALRGVPGFVGHRAPT